MRKLTDVDMENILGATVKGFHVEAVRVKRGSFTDSDHYGILLGKNADGHYITWQFHLDEDEEVNPYWGRYFLENRNAALRDYKSRDLDIDKSTVWKRYLRYLRVWIDSHKDAGFYGMTPACFDEWFGNEYREDQIETATDSPRSFKVTITETLQQSFTVTASDPYEAEEMVQSEWNNQDHILDADNFIGVEFEAVPSDEQEESFQ